MSEKQKKWVKRVYPWVVGVLSAVLWPYALGVMMGLFAFLVVIGIAVAGFKILH